MSTPTALRDILARRAVIRDEMQNASEARFAELETEATALNEAERRASVLADIDRRAAGRPVADPHFDREQARVSLADVVRAQLGGTDVASGRAREMSQELARRSGRSPAGMLYGMGSLPETETRIGSVTTPAAGPAGNLIATGLAVDSFIQRLYPAIRVRQLGALILPDLVGNVDVPRLKGSTTAGWVADGSPLTASDGQFDKVSLRPKTAGVLTEVSRLAMLQSTPGIDALLMNDMARMLAVTLDSAAIAGNGTGNAPTGILNTAGIGSYAMGTNGAALTYQAPINLMGAIQDANADTAGLAFLGNYKVKRAGALLLTTYNEPLTEDVVFQSMPRAFTTSVPSTLTKGTSAGVCSALIFGNFTDLLIGIWSALDISVNPYATASYAAGNVQIRAMMTCDIAVRHPESFAAIQDILA